MAGQPYGKAGAKYWDARFAGIKNIPKVKKPAAIVLPDTVGASTKPIDYSPAKNLLSGADHSGLGGGKVEDEKESGLSKALNAPVIKQLLDGLSVFNYAGANIANNFVDSAEKGGNIFDYLGDIPEGIGQGLSGATGNAKNARTYGDVIGRVQDNMGVDKDSTGAKVLRGVGGFAGDVLLDPTTYIGVGAVKAGAKGLGAVSTFNKAGKTLRAVSNVEGAKKGFVAGKITDDFSAELAKADDLRKLETHEQLPFDAVRPSKKAAENQKVRDYFIATKGPIRQAATSRREAFTAGFSEGLHKYRLDERARKIGKRDNKAARKAGVVKKYDELGDHFKWLETEVPNMTVSTARASAVQLINDFNKANGITESNVVVRGRAEDMLKDMDVSPMPEPLPENINFLERTDPYLDTAMPEGVKPSENVIANKGDVTAPISKSAVPVEGMATQGRLFNTKTRRTANAEKMAEQREIADFNRLEVDRRKKGIARSSSNARYSETNPRPEPFDALSDYGTDTPPLFDTNTIGTSRPALPVSAGKAVGKADEVNPNAVDNVANPNKAPENSANDVPDIDSTKSVPAEKSPQEAQRAAKEEADIIEGIANDPVSTAAQMGRAQQSEQAIHAAFAVQTIRVPINRAFEGGKQVKSTFQYSSSTVEAVKRLTTTSASKGLSPERFLEVVKGRSTALGLSTSQINQLEAAVMSKDAARIAPFLNGKSFPKVAKLYKDMSSTKDVAKVMPSSAFTNVGIHPEDVEFARSGMLQTIDTETELLHDMRDITKAIRGLNKDGIKAPPEHPLWEVVNNLEDIFDVKGVKAVAAALKTAAQSADFKAATKFTTGERVSKSQKFAGLTHTVGDDEIKQFLTPVPVEEAVKGQQMAMGAATTRVTNVDPDLPGRINNIIKDAIKFQKTKMGPKKTTRTGASVTDNEAFARINKDWNTQAQMKGYGDINRMVLDYMKRDKNFMNNRDMRDELLMSSLKYYDETLRSHGIDFHLTNMAPRMTSRKTLADGDAVIQGVANPMALTVRGGLSDALEAMGPELRKQFVHGGAMKLRPTQILDIYEMAVRSATRLNAAVGDVDYTFAKFHMLQAVMGKFGDNRILGKGSISRIPEIDEIDKLKELNTQFYYREIKNHGDYQSRKYNLESAARRLKDVEGNDKFANDEIRAIFDDKIVDGKRQQKTIDSIVNELRVSLGSGGVVDGLDVLEHGMKQIDTELKELVEALFIPGADNLTPFSKMVNSSLKNTAQVSGKITELVKYHSTQKYDEVINAIEKGTVGDTREAIINALKTPDSLAPDAREMITAATEAKLSERVSKADSDLVVNAGKLADKVNSKAPVEEITKQRVENFRELPRNKEMQDSAFDIATDETLGLSKAEKQTAIQTADDLIYTDTVTELSDSVFNKIGGIQAKTQRYYGQTDDVKRVVGKSTHAVSEVMATTQKSLADLAKMGIDDVAMRDSLGVIAKVVNQGGDLNQLTGNHRTVADLFNTLFDTSNYNFFKAGGVTGPGMNRFVTNLKQSFSKEADALDITRLTDSEIATAWTQWDIKNPSSFISKMTFVYAKTAQEMSIAESFSKKFGSLKQGPNMIKIAPNDSNVFSTLIDNTRWYPEELGDQTAYISKMLNENRQISGSLGEFVKNVFDPVVSILKMSQTSLKPGHHVMSIVGDGWRNQMLTGSLMGPEYKNAMKVVGYVRHRRKMENPIDAIHRAFDSAQGNEFSRVKGVRGPDDSMSVPLWNSKTKKKEITEVPMHKVVALMEEHGVLMSPHSGGVQEDLLSELGAGAASGVGRQVKTGVEFLMHNKATGPISDFANTFSADRDGVTRGALFLKYLSERRFNTLEEAADYAGQKLRKAAPIAADLSTWESKWARRSIFYYTWLRGITPVVLETLLTRPGIAMVPSKGMFELANANGLDPNSIGDPFSEELKGKLPSYMTEKVSGPAWMDEQTGDVMGFNTYGPAMDVLNSFGSGVSANDLNPFGYRNGDAEDGAATKIGKTILGMSTPWLRFPVETVSGRRIDSGVPIDSKLQYYQDQFSFLRTPSKLAGKNLDGLNRTESRYRDGMEHPEGRGEEMLNYLFSPGLTNYSSERYEKSRQFEDMDDAGKQKKLEQRLGREDEDK